MDIIELIANTGGTLALAIFSIYMLNRNFKEQEATWKGERQEMLKTIERNTDSWIEAAKFLAILIDRVNGEESTAE